MMRILISTRLSTILLMMLLAACESTERTGQVGEFIAPDQVQVEKHLDPTQVKLGEQVYRQHCATCHGVLAQGTENWRHTDAEGKYPPPPLNGTAHAWHHPTEVLKEVILDGSMGDGNMPAWRGKLTEQQVDAVIAWLQSLWPDEVYSVWYDLDRRYREEN